MLDPETLHQIAGLYEKVGDLEEAARYMELTVAQETGARIRLADAHPLAPRRGDQVTWVTLIVDSTSPARPTAGMVLVAIP